jgi:hypothetical protein
LEVGNRGRGGGILDKTAVGGIGDGYARQARLRQHALVRPIPHQAAGKGPSLRADEAALLPVHEAELPAALVPAPSDGAIQ